MIVLLAAVVLVHLGSMLAYRGSAVDAANVTQASQIAGRLAAARRTITSMPPGKRDQAAHKLSSADLTLRWDVRPILESSKGSNSNLRSFRRDLSKLLPTIAGDSIRLKYADRQSSGDAHTIVGSLPLADASYINFSFPILAGAGPAFHAALLSTSVMAVGIAIVVILLVRTLVSPLRELARAADAIGRGPEVAVPEAGPDEVRYVAQAFNGMQARIQRLISDRTQALAAVSHDLRTPITRLRLRAGFLADQEVQTAIDADLDEMEAMIDATLAYLRGDVEPEALRMTDLSAMLATLVDAAADTGASATFDGPHPVFLPLRALAVKRAFTNLIDNALTYGGAVRVTLSTTDTGVFVTVDDDGPGIPDSELERVFEPFQRLDSSRNRRTGGVGLGLAIVRQAIGREGGSVRLLNRSEGGLRAEVVIPRRKSKQQPQNLQLSAVHRAACALGLSSLL